VRAGVCAGDPVDILHGQAHDLSQRANVQRLSRELRDQGTRVVWAAPPCTLWSVFQVRVNFKGRKPELNKVRRAALREVVDVHQMLDAAGVGWMIENPETSELWDTKYMKKVAADAGVTTIKLDSCAFSHPAKKPFRILSNLPSMVLEPLQGHTCSCTGKHERQSVGRHAKGSGSYTPLLASCIANVIANAVKGGSDQDDPVMAVSQERDAPGGAEGFFEVDSGTSVSVVSRAHVRVLSVDVGVKIKTRGFQSATATAPMDVGTVCVVLTEERTDEEVLGVLHYVAISDHAAGISLLDPVQLHERGFHVDLNLTDNVRRRELLTVY